jgi:hypothetical protein
MAAAHDATDETASTDLIFVSYSQADRETAYELVADLEARGLRCWIAPRDIAPSAEWAAEIITAISAARIMVLLFSRASNDSPQVRREVERAVHKRVPVIAFRIEDVLPERSLEYFLSAQHWLDAFPAPREHYYASLYQYLRRALASKAAPSLTQAPVTRGPTEPTIAVPASAPIAPPIAPPIDAPWSAGDLEALERGLSDYLGPIAALLVKRAAAKAGNLADLRSSLAGELATETERRQFLSRVSN